MRRTSPASKCGKWITVLILGCAPLRGEAPDFASEREASLAPPLDTSAVAIDSTVRRDSVPNPAPPSPRPAPRKAPRGRRKAGRSRLSHEASARVDIPAGCFWMGSPDGTGNANERPRHRVCLDSFRMDRLPVTQRVFEEATGLSPWRLCEGPLCAAPDPKDPAWFVTWSEAADFCRSRGGRLPTEAEFEYAARAGDSGAYIWGDSMSQACRYANFADMSLGRVLPSWKTFPCDDGEVLVAPVGEYRPNRWGLYDMAGNVWEWTSDWYAANAYAKSPARDPTGPDSGSGRVIRGGSWLSSPDGGRAAYRDGFQPEGRYNGAIGFRCVYPSR